MYKVRKSHFFYRGDSMKQDPAESFLKGVIKSFGLVFGDIGTSPIYTLTVIFALTKPTPDNVHGYTLPGLLDHDPSWSPPSTPGWP